MSTSSRQLDSESGFTEHGVGSYGILWRSGVSTTLAIESLSVLGSL